jgi:rare lipoprotein A (peptidoglycan hydrolase)
VNKVTLLFAALLFAAIGINPSMSLANLNSEGIDQAPPLVAELLEDQSYEGAEVQNLDVSDNEDEIKYWLEEMASENAETIYVDEEGNEYYLPEEDFAGTLSLKKKRRGSARNCVASNGVASWYGPGFNGRKTANGERFNQNALTAAHKTLKFGTILKVTYNGRSVKVRVNDAGPYVGGRVIDLSKAAAQAIGLIGSGHGRVTLQVISCG